MHKRIIHGVILLLAAFSTVSAAPVITVGTHYLFPNSQRTIPITVSGGDLVSGLNFFIQVANGGPKITGIDIIGPGTLFSQSNRGSVPMHYPDSGGTYLIWSDWTVTQPGVQLAATATPEATPLRPALAYATFDTTGMTANNAYALNLANVAPNDDTTDFGGVSATINAGWIVITDLRNLTWNASASGNWTATTWSGTLPGYAACPNYTSNAIVNTSHTVDVTTPQEANSLALSNGGQVSISSAGSLTLSNGATIANGSILQVGGILTAQNISLNGSMNLTTGGSAHVAGITGSGALTVGNGSTPSTLTATSITLNSMTVASGSTITINAMPGGPVAGDATMASVPEPSTITLLILAALGILFYCKRN